MKYKGILVVVVFCLILGGCKMRSDRVDESNKIEDDKYYIPVQEYTGKEYPANEKKERWEYIEEHKKEIEDKAIEWVKETFGLEVKINHMYPKNDAAIATAEWLNDSNLKIKVVIRLGLNEKGEFAAGIIPSMDAENNIMSYLAYRAYQEEFSELESLLDEFCKNENLYGRTNEYIHNIGGFTSLDRNYYYISGSHLSYKKTYSAFLDNPSISSSEVKKIFELEYEEDKQSKIEIDQEYGVSFQISLYSNSDKIDESLFKVLEAILIEQSYLPDFNYAITLNENSMDTRSGRAISIHYPRFPTETGYIKVNKEKE